MNFTAEHNTIRRYVQGKMSREEQYDFEMRMLDDPFLSDAVEGFEADPGALFDLPVVDAGNGFWMSKWFWLTHTAITIALIGFVLYSWMGDDGISESLPEEPAKTTIEPVFSETEISPLPENEQITAAIAIEESPKMLEAGPDNAEIAMPVESRGADRERLEVPAMPARAATATTLHAPIIRTSNVSFRYIRDLKVVHYGDLYREGIPTEKVLETGGTEARYEQPTQTGERRPLGVLPQSLKRTYAETLEMTLGDFVQADYQKALAGFTRILSTYPDDNNALFYAGLCYYNLGHFSKSEKYFEQVELHYINTFDQEAQWYRALSLAQAGEKERSRQLFEKIAVENGHYAGQAAEKLK